MTVYALDVQTAFLHGELEEEIFMKIPEGYTEDQEFYETKALKLNKAINGLVQAARQWWKKFNYEIIKLGFKGNNVDPCLFYKEENEEKYIITLYVDDSIIADEKRLIEETITSLERFLKSKYKGV
jgi:hypothetical protein